LKSPYIGFQDRSRHWCPGFDSIGWHSDWLAHPWGKLALSLPGQI